MTRSDIVGEIRAAIEETARRNAAGRIDDLEAELQEVRDSVGQRVFSSGGGGDVVRSAFSVSAAESDSGERVWDVFLPGRCVLVENVEAECDNDIDENTGCARFESAEGTYVCVVYNKGTDDDPEYHYVIHSPDETPEEEEDKILARFPVFTLETDEDTGTHSLASNENLGVIALGTGGTGGSGPQPDEVSTSLVSGVTGASGPTPGTLEIKGWHEDASVSGVSVASELGFEDSTGPSATEYEVVARKTSGPTASLVYLGLGKAAVPLAVSGEAGGIDTVKMVTDMRYDTESHQLQFKYRSVELADGSRIRSVSVESDWTMITGGQAVYHTKDI